MVGTSQGLIFDVKCAPVLKKRIKIALFRFVRAKNAAFAKRKGGRAFWLHPCHPLARWDRAKSILSRASCTHIGRAYAYKVKKYSLILRIRIEILDYLCYNIKS